MKAEGGSIQFTLIACPETRLASDAIMKAREQIEAALYDTLVYELERLIPDARCKMRLED